jgi:DNA-binding response OmpR family regulator
MRSLDHVATTFTTGLSELRVSKEGVMSDQPLPEGMELYIASAPRRPYMRAALAALAGRLGERSLMELTPQELQAFHAELTQRLSNATARRDYWLRITAFLRAEYALGHVSIAVAVEVGIDPLLASPDGRRLRVYARLRAADREIEIGLRALARFFCLRVKGPLAAEEDELAEYFAEHGPDAPGYVSRAARAFYAAQFALRRVSAEVALAAGCTTRELCQDRRKLAAFVDTDLVRGAAPVVDRAAGFFIVRYQCGPLFAGLDGVRAFFAEVVDVLAAEQRSATAVCLRELYAWGVRQNLVTPAIAAEVAWLAAPDRVVHLESITVDPDGRRAWWQGRQIELGPVESKALTCLASHGDRYVLKSDLTAATWTDEPPDARVLNLIHALRVKLGDEPSWSRALIFDRRQGYMLRLTSHDEPQLSEAMVAYAGRASYPPYARTGLGALHELLDGRDPHELQVPELRELLARLGRDLPTKAACQACPRHVKRFLREQLEIGRVRVDVAVEVGFDPIVASPDRQALEAYLEADPDRAWESTEIRELARRFGELNKGPLSATRYELAKLHSQWGDAAGPVRRFYAAQFSQHRVSATVALAAGCQARELCEDRAQLAAFLATEFGGGRWPAVNSAADFFIRRNGRGPLFTDVDGIRAFFDKVVNKLRSEDRDELAAAIRELYAWAVRERHTDESVAEEAACLAAPDRVVRAPQLTVDVDGHRAWWRGNQLELGPVAVRALAYFARNVNHVVSRRAVTDAAWGGEPGTSANAGKVVAHLREKLGDDPAHPRILVTLGATHYVLLLLTSSASAAIAASGSSVELWFGELRLDRARRDLAGRDLTAVFPRLTPGEERASVLLMRAAGRTVPPGALATVRSANRVTTEQLAELFMSRSAARVQVVAPKRRGMRLEGDDGHLRLWGIEVDPDDDAIVIEARKRRLSPPAIRLCARLAAAYGVPVDEDDLVIAIWPEGDGTPAQLVELVAEVNQAAGVALIAPANDRGYRLAVELYNPALVRFDVLSLDPGTGLARIADRLIDLAIMPAAILAYLIDRPDRSVELEAIAASVGLQLRTTEDHVGALRHALGVWPTGSECLVSLPSRRCRLLGPIQAQSGPELTVGALALRDRVASYAGTRLRLGPTQIDLLGRVMRHPGRAFAARELDPDARFNHPHVLRRLSRIADVIGGVAGDHGPALVRWVAQDRTVRHCLIPPPADASKPRLEASRGRRQPSRRLPGAPTRCSFAHQRDRENRVHSRKDHWQRRWPGRPHRGAGKRCSEQAADPPHHAECGVCRNERRPLVSFPDRRERQRIDCVVGPAAQEDRHE